MRILRRKVGDIYFYWIQYEGVRELQDYFKQNQVKQSTYDLQKIESFLLTSQVKSHNFLSSQLVNSISKTYITIQIETISFELDDPANPGPASNPNPETGRPDSPVAQILEAIPAELYVPNQQQWIGLRKNAKILPFCCR